MRLRSITPVLATLLVVLAGCGGTDNPATGTGTPTGKQALEDLAQLLKDFDAKKQKPPAAVTAVAPVEPLYQAAYLGLVRGDILYAWGTPLGGADGGTVIAHEKQAPTEGGWVLLKNGEVKQMTADEFKAVPKAGK